MATEQPVPALVDDVVEDILVRFPPDDPAALVRAALVCKYWRRLVSDLGFRRRFRDVHGTAPMLGFIRQRGAVFRFQPTTSFRPRFALASDSSGTIYRYRALDARHGRVLVNSYSHYPAHDVFVVWDPISGDQRKLPRPRFLPSCISWSAAFVCVAAGCDHLDCPGGPFRVIFVVSQLQSLASVYVYSSEIGVWSDKISTCTLGHMRLIGSSGRSAMVGNALYFWFKRRRGILKHDLDTQKSCVVQTPAFIDGERVLLMATEDGRLGFAMIKQYKLSLWSRGASVDSGNHADAGWAQNRVIELNTLLPASALLNPPQLVAFADSIIGANIMVQTVDGLFTIDLKSSHVKEIGKGLKLHSYGVVPFVSFCTPALGAASSGVVHHKLKALMSKILNQAEIMMV